MCTPSSWQCQQLAQQCRLRTWQGQNSSLQPRNVGRAKTIKSLRKTLNFSRKVDKSSKAQCARACTRWLTSEVTPHFPQTAKDGGKAGGAYLYRNRNFRFHWEVSGEGGQSLFFREMCKCHSQLTVFTQRNFVADFCQAKCYFRHKKAGLRFWAPALYGV